MCCGDQFLPVLKHEYMCTVLVCRSLWYYYCQLLDLEQMQQTYHCNKPLCVNSEFPTETGNKFLYIT